MLFYYKNGLPFHFVYYPVPNIIKTVQILECDVHKSGLRFLKCDNYVDYQYLVSVDSVRFEQTDICHL